MADSKKKKREKTSSKKTTKRGRPVGSKNKAKIETDQSKLKPKRKRGRPKGSKNKALKRDYIKKLEADILSTAEGIDVDIDIVADIVEEIEEETDETTTETKVPRTILEQIMFKLPCVPDPLIGTPKQVQKELDILAMTMQKKPNDELIFNKIHLYMHGYLINVVLKKFPFIRGYQSVDIYQETLIALRFKSIPGFKMNKGMSFLNFAKMCIRRHLITLLNASKNRKKDQSMNRSISLDCSPMGDDDDENNTFANIITDKKAPADKIYEASDAFEATKANLFKHLSEFEQIVLREYLTGESYKDVSKNVSKCLHRRYNTKSIDNALHRIRKKALHLLEFGKVEDLPIFMKKS